MIDVYGEWWKLLRINLKEKFVGFSDWVWNEIDSGDFRILSVSDWENE